MKPLGRAAAPIAVQVVALLIAGLVVAQLVNLAVVLVLPPPRPAVYNLGEIAAALQGRSRPPRFGRPLIRSLAARPPAAATGLPQSRDDLARLLAVPPDQVRLSGDEGPAWAGPWHGPPPFARDPRGGPGPDLGPDGPPPIGAPPPEDGRSPPPPPRFDPGQRPIFGDFTAALRQPDGGWAIVRPVAEPFPNSWQWRIMLWFGACVAVFSLAGYGFARRMTAPISAFAAAAERLGRDPRGPPMALSGPAELGAAALAFNQMQVRIRRYVEDRTAMVGAISHDLRTPLTRIRFRIEDAEPQLRAAVLSDLGQMEEMISAVLVFIRDANAPARRERIDLLSLVECEVDGAALSGADVTLETEEPIILAADPLGLQRLVANLIGNAVQYAGSARVSLRREGDEAVIEVADEGPGLAAAELERVFEPFYRGESSRNRETGGTGLGLAVARSIARAHGGDLVLVARERGLMAVARLPLPKI